MVRLLRHIRCRVQGFRRDASGQIIILFALMSTVLVFAGGAGIDLMRAYQARQILSNVATLACQYASTPAIARLAVPDPTGARTQPDYAATVNAYIASALATQKFGWTQTNAPAFTYVRNGRADVRLVSSVPTSLTRVLRIQQVPVAATIHCYDSPATIPPPVTDPGTLVDEGGEAGPPGAAPPTADHGNWWAWGIPGKGISSTPSSSPGSTPAYVGSKGAKWYVTGYCLETDRVGVVSATVAEGQRSIELDCDDGAYGGGNSAISTKVYLAVGNYELRYSYISRVGYPNYYPAYLCGSDARDLSWANDPTMAGASVPNAPRTNQINAYLDRDTTGSAPLHWTIDGMQQLAGSNLIDHCVYAGEWTERSVRITVDKPDNYWLSFAADGQSDGVGGEIDNIRLCIKTCAGTPGNNFPASWAADGTGAPKILFEDTFDRPAYAQDPAITVNRTKGGNLANSLGTSGWSSGWPLQASSGWATGPYNQVDLWLQDAYQGSQYVSLQGWDGFSTGTDTINRLISRKFLLVPGYYRVSYGYTSMVDFSSAGFVSGPYCTSAPASGAIYPNNRTVYQGRPRYASATAPVTIATNVLGVFMSSGQLVSTLNPNTARGAAADPTLGGQASYTNPDGTVTTVPAVPPDRVNWTSYDATARNPVIDTCGYAVGYTWVPRSANVKIAKPGWYWLTFSAQGNDYTGTGNGPAIDDVKLTALGGPSMPSPPTPAVAIPVPDPQPGRRASFDGFAIIVDPFVAPAPLQ